MPRHAALALCAAALAVHAAAAPRPNLIIILTDDQDILLNGTSAMPALAAEMVAGGTSLRGFVDVPVCCPSRTSTLAGRYSHNLNNTEMGWCGNFLDAHVNRTWVKDLKDAGYSTALFGKCAFNANNRPPAARRRLTILTPTRDARPTTLNQKTSTIIAPSATPRPLCRVTGRISTQCATTTSTLATRSTLTGP